MGRSFVEFVVLLEMTRKKIEQNFLLTKVISTPLCVNCIIKQLLRQVLAKRKGTAKKLISLQWKPRDKKCHCSEKNV